MIIKYCPKCFGKPYTTNLENTKCSQCGAVLLSEIADETTLKGREKMSSFNSEQFDNSGFGFSDTENDFPEAASSGFGDEPNSNQFGFGDTSKDEKTEFDQKFGSDLPSNFGSNEVDNYEDNSRPTFSVGNKPIGNEKIINSKDFDTVIRGKITNYSNSQKENIAYKRNIIKKLMDAIVFKQKLDDILHSFTVRVNSDEDAFGNKTYHDIPVNVHGVISSGLQLRDNLEVEVIGKYNNGVLMAKGINILNNGYKTPVAFQRSIKAILYGILAVFALGFLIYIGASSGGNFFQNIGSFLKTWLITSFVVTVLYFLLSFSKVGIMTRMASGRPRKFPLVGILLVSLVLTLIFVNSFGLGASVGSLLSGLFSSIISIVVIVVVLFIVFKLLLGLF